MTLFEGEAELRRRKRLPFQGRSVGEERLRFVDLALSGERTIRDLCQEFGISRQSGHRWLNRYREEGATAVLAGRSRKPHQSPGRTSDEVTAAIVQIRRSYPDWGAPKLQHLLRKQHPAWKMSVSTVHRILVRHELIHKNDRHSRATRKFERDEPNQLWQMDFKGPSGFRQRSGPLSVIDDHSRYLLALKHLDSGRCEAVMGCLRHTFENHGMPEAMLMDHGTPWWNANSPWGWTELSVWLMRHGVRILLSGYRHPQTQGKVERMHGALHRAIRRRHADADQQQWLDAFRREYNTLRPHEALGMETPCSRWKPSQHEYRDEPKPWDYPTDCEVVRVEESGRIRWQNQSKELSRALRGERVGLKTIGDRIVVYFCNTPIGELDPNFTAVARLPVDPFRSLQC